jgi:uncharacterized lipoprotein YajG
MALFTGTQLDIAADVRNEMGKYLASLMFAGCALVASPLSATPAATEPRTADATSTVAVQQVRVPVTGLRDEAAMVLVGTALIGLAAAVRRGA